VHICVQRSLASNPALSLTRGTERVGGQGDGRAAELVNRGLTVSLIATFLMLVVFTVTNLSVGAFAGPVNHWAAVPNILPICLQVPHAAPTPPAASHAMLLPVSTRERSQCVWSVE
jgi:hypothetical protein